MSKTKTLFEVGKLYCDRGDFAIATERLREAREQALVEKEFDLFLKAQNLLLRMHAERDEFDEINVIKERLQDLVISESYELSSKTYYSLGLCAHYKGQYETALEYLQKAMAIALEQDDKVDMCYAISGLMICYIALEKYSEALREIYNLQVFFQVIDLPELKLGAQINNGRILRNMGRYEEALEIFWSCYDDVKKTKNMATMINLLFYMGTTYLDMGDKEMARVYLSLAQKSVDPSNMRHLSRLIESRMASLGGEVSQNFDLIFDSINHAVIEKKIGKVDFKNQFILLDLLRLFVQYPGQVFSKEDLVDKIWKQSYDPMVHDNKIYVTIKRLR
ncbi:MAG: tetratricopeptide repeat protein [Pseudobdellovibrionaceae bacterium]